VLQPGTCAFWKLQLAAKIIAQCRSSPCSCSLGYPPLYM
jgi:hypothetical protein